MQESARIRNQVLTAITQVLLRPSDYGDRFFVQMVNADTQGFIPINLLTSMVSELKDVPVGYIEHCADLEPHRLELNVERTKVRLPDPRFNVAEHGPETDPYGAIDREDSRSASPADSATLSEMKPSTYFRPYKITFLHTVGDISSEDDDNDGEAKDAKNRLKVSPVCFDNGKFYVDAEPYKRVREDRPLMEVPPYDIADIAPFGSTQKRESKSVCWNCESEDHTYSNCPEPRNEELIRKHRKAHQASGGNSGGPTFGRFYVELALRNKVATFAPGKLSEALQEALGMNEHYNEPPYYARMRQHGYPPGYWGTQENEDPLSGQSQMRRRAAAGGSPEEIIFGDVSPLKIYDDNYQESDKDDDIQEKSSAIPAGAPSSRRVKLVHYPGLEEEVGNHNVASMEYTQYGYNYYHQQPAVYDYHYQAPYHSYYSAPYSYTGYSAEATTTVAQAAPAISDVQNTDDNGEADMDISDDED